MPDPVPTLAGDPPVWPATLRDLLRAATDGRLDRAAVLEGLAGDRPPEDGATDDGAVQRRLTFLEAADVFDCEDGGCTPSRHGREYLQTHDESVLLEAVAGAADGFETVLEALAVRPLSDVEVADLLGTERDADVDGATAARYLAWLRALGYISRRDDVNDLTRKGRRLVATTEALTPPGADADQPERLEDAPSTAPHPADEGNTGATSDPTDTRSRPADGTKSETDATDAPDGADGLLSSEGSGEDAALVVDADLERELRSRYDDTCMLCGDRRQCGPDAGYAEVHFLMPRAAPHDGPAAAANAVVVCPNHRADLEHGAVTIDPQTRSIDHAYEPAVSGRTLSTAADHEVGAQYLAYHNDVVAD